MVLFAPLLTPCFHGGPVRRARPGKVVSLYMTSLTASQKSKLSIVEALAVGTTSEAPALGLGRIPSCHSPVAQITKRGATVCLHAFFVVSCTPAGLICPVNLSGLHLSAGLLLQRLSLSWKPDTALHQCRATHARSATSRIHSPFFSEYRRNSHICHLRDFGSWRSISDAPTSILGQVLVHEIYL